MTFGFERSINRSEEVENLLIRANDMMKHSLYDEAEKYYNKVLDIDAKNAIANRAMEKLYKIIKYPNFFVLVTTGPLYNTKVQVEITVTQI